MQEKQLNLDMGDQERGPFLVGREDRMVLGVAGCGPGELAPGEAHIPLSLGTKGNQEGSPWVEYITRRTGGTYPVVSSFIGHAFKLFL